MIAKIHDILGSETCEWFSITFLYHVIIIAVLSLIASAKDNITHPHILTIINEDIILVDTEKLVIENPEFSPEITSFSNDTLPVVESSSLNADIDAELPVLLSQTLVDDSDNYLTMNEIVNQNISGSQNNIDSSLSNASSAGNALDRLTVEIIDNAQTKDVNVVWLFDSSVSLNYQRQQIYNRFNKILEEIAIAQAPYSIHHSICSFGKDIKFLTDQPTDNLTILQKDISEIIIDDSGIENTFNAVGLVCKQYSKPQTRCLVIVFTDEVGDDISLSDSVGNFARMKNCKIYVVGSPAPFGKTITQFKFVEFDPRYDQTEKWVEIQQGPETLFPMTLNIKTLPIDNETLDSGFGSFALSKLCLDTGGIFFSVHPNRSLDKVNKQSISPLSSYISRFFDHSIMMKYKPDYRAVSAQNKEAQSHISKKSLIQAASISLNITGEQTLRFKAFNEGSFVNELNMAQRFSAKIEPKINEIYNTLLVGERGYQTLEDRWKVSYALAMGRILSTKCRIESYNLVLAEAKTGLKKQNPKSNIWILIPSKEFDLNNSLLKKCYEGSQKYLKFVVDNYPDTPWAFIANEELNTPISYKWQEDYEEPPKPREGNGGNNNPSDDKPKPKLIPKPQRKIDKI